MHGLEARVRAVKRAAKGPGGEPYAPYKDWPPMRGGYHPINRWKTLTSESYPRALEMKSYACDG